MVAQDGFPTPPPQPHALSEADPQDQAARVRHAEPAAKKDSLWEDGMSGSLSLGRDLDQDFRSTGVAERRESKPRDKRIYAETDDQFEILPVITSDLAAMKRYAREGQRGDAALFARLVHNRCLYDHTKKAWRIYHDGVWELDDIGRVARKAGPTLRAAYFDACEQVRKAEGFAPGGPPEGEKASSNGTETGWDGFDDEAEKERDRRTAALRKKCVSLCSLGYVEDVLKLARTLLPTRIQDMDANKLLFKCLNGTLDLATGEFREHSPDDMVTRRSGVSHAVGAQCPKWDQFVQTLFDGNLELVRFLQRALGYCLSGETDTDLLIFCYGMGRNGKSTLFEVVSRILGEYFTTLPIEAILDQGRAGRDTVQQYEILRLMGTRMALSSEIPQGRRLNEALVKQLTGGDEIVARAPFQLPVSFRPTHKIFLAGNHQPIIQGDDDGIWRRVCLVPFSHRFPAPGEPDYRDRGAVVADLIAEGSGILNWLHEGYREAKKTGLNPPASVTAATRAYREDSDIVGSFVRSRCVMEPNAKSSIKALYLAYKQWCEDLGETPMTNRGLSASLLRIDGIRRDRTGSARCLAGVRVWTASELRHAEKRPPEPQEPAEPF